MAKGWTMDRIETLALGASFDAQIDSGVVLTGSPTVTVWEQTASGENDWTDRTPDFTVGSAQVNTSTFENEKGATVAVGRGVVFELTTPDDPGKYKVEIQCGADDGTNPKVVKSLKVDGPGTGA